MLDPTPILTPDPHTDPHTRICPRIFIGTASSAVQSVGSDTKTGVLSTKREGRLRMKGIILFAQGVTLPTSRRGGSA